ncbi:hypothetical protein [Pararhizobium sp. O133]|uniref:hypothetical protein n=1 Tax=Pararhizobium sp. O133 TaxID=3449278 RepID=UPI003F687E1D
MSGQDLNLEKNRRGRPAIGRGEQVNVMLRPEIVAALDMAAAGQDDGGVARPEMVRRIIVDWLQKAAFLDSEPAKSQAKKKAG